MSNSDGEFRDPSRYVYDYFVKDHLGNVRMVLTEEEQRDIYPIATLEGDKASATSSIGRAKLFYDIDTSKIVSKTLVTNIPNYQNNNAPLFTNQATADSAQNSQQLYKLIALNNTGVTGLGMTLKVMGGDKVSVYGKSYYHDANTSGTNYDVPVLDLLNGMIGNPLGGAAGKGVTGSTLNGITSIASAVQAFRDDPNRDPSSSSVPKASLNWILFDEQFKPVSGTMGFKRVTAANTLEDLKQLQIEIPKNGYLYVYCSNESPTAVFFDNVQVVHDRSRILEETHYYPFGLTMAGISSKAAGGIDNKYGITNKEIQQNEFSDGTGLEWYDFGARMLDPQLGRWHSLDPLADAFYNSSPYTYVLNNPLTYIDPDGMFSTHTDSLGNVVSVIDDGDLSVYKHNNDKEGTKKEVAKNHSKDDTSAGGEMVGRTLEWNSFKFEGDGKPIGKIDFASTEALTLIVQTLYKVQRAGGATNDGEANLLRLYYYMINGTGGQQFDVKKIGGSDPENMYRGSQISNGVYVSARDAGNFIAGRVAGKYNVSYTAAAVAFGALNLSGNKSVGSLIGNIPNALSTGPQKFYGEKQISHALQYRGYFNIIQ